MTYLVKQDRFFVFPMKTYRNFKKQIFMMKNFYRDQLGLIRIFRINLVLLLKMSSRQPYWASYFRL